MAGTLTTARLVLVPVDGGDADALHQLWTNKEVRRYLWDNRIIPIETVHQIIEASDRYFEKTGSGFYSVRLKTDPDAIIGFCGNRAFEDAEEIELLYGIHPDFWSRGLGTEAAQSVLQHGIGECGFERVIAATDTPNQRSVRVMHRLGMFFDRRQKHHGLDTVFYSMRAVDLPERRQLG